MGHRQLKPAQIWCLQAYSQIGDTARSKAAPDLMYGPIYCWSGCSHSNLPEPGLPIIMCLSIQEHLMQHPRNATASALLVQVWLQIQDTPLLECRGRQGIVQRGWRFYSRKMWRMCLCMSSKPQMLCFVQEGCDISQITPGDRCFAAHPGLFSAGTPGLPGHCAAWLAFLQPQNVAHVPAHTQQASHEGKCS